MKVSFLILVAALILGRTCVSAQAVDASPSAPPSAGPQAGGTIRSATSGSGGPGAAAAPSGAKDIGKQQNPNASPIFGVTIPPGYRQWEVIGVSQETGALDELRAILGNPLALKAYRSDKLPFPDGTILAKLAYKRVANPEFPPAFVPGDPTTVQIMVKDSKKYAATGGWGFGRFVNGKPVDIAQHQTCFACHAANVKDHDRVFTRLVP